MERIPLLNKQKKEVYQLWCDIHQEDLFHRKRLLKEYCHTNDCDIVLAIDYIISQIKDKVFLFYNSKASYVSDKDNGETSTTDLENLLYSEFAKEGIVNYYEEYAKSNKHYILNSKFSNIQIISEKIVKEDIKLLQKLEEFFENLDKEVDNEVDTVDSSKVGFIYANSSKSIEKSENNNTTNNNSNDKFDYKLMTELLHPYILNGTEEIYRSVIEKHVLPLNAQTLRMKDDKKSDIVRFADCFDIPISKINKIFDIKVASNDRPKALVNDFYRKLKEINPLFNSNK